MEMLLDTIWMHPVLRLFALLVAGEFLLLVGCMLTLGVQIWRQVREHRHYEAAQRDLREGVVPAVGGDEEAREGWLREARRCDPKLVGRLLREYALVTEGSWRRGLAELYRELGLMDHDVSALRSRDWQQRMVAMRHLYLMASPKERGALLALREDRQPIRLLAAQTLARVGEPEDVLRVLETLELHHNLMEQPLYASFHAMHPQAFEALFGGWHDIRSPSLRKIALSVAAERALPGVMTAIEQARTEEALELRIGAATAAGKLQDERSLEILEGLARDPAWEVRARAARELGRRAEPEALELLAAVLRDEAFWVRQNAAASLRRQGPEGRRRLEQIAADEGADRFAADAASQELQRFKLFPETIGV